MAACTIGNATLAFGAYVPTSGTANDAQTTVSVLCTNGSVYEIFSTTALVDRTLAIGGTSVLPGEVLTYRLFASDAARSTGTVDLPLVIGAGSIGGTGNGEAQDVAIFGRLAAAQNVKFGAYTNLTGANLTINY